MIRYELEVVGCRLKVVGYGSEVVGYEPKVVGYGLEVEVYEHVEDIFLIIHASLSMIHC